MNIEGPSLRDLHARGIFALREHIARAFTAQPLPAVDTPHNAADFIESGQVATDRKLDRDVAA